MNTRKLIELLTIVSINSYCSGSTIYYLALTIGGNRINTGWRKRRTARDRLG